MKKRKEKNKLDVVFILDRSGSMHDCVLDTIGGYNSYLDSQKNKKAKITTVTFSDNISYLYFREDINNVKSLDEKDYVVGGCTALYDAIGTTIERLDCADIKNRVLFVITTDGMENASCRFNKKKISKLIKTHPNWEFIYLGANIDSYEEGSTIGIKKERISNYSKEDQGVKKMFKAIENMSCSLYEDNYISDDWNKELE